MGRWGARGGGGGYRKCSHGILHQQRVSNRTEQFEIQQCIQQPTYLCVIRWLCFAPTWPPPFPLLPLPLPSPHGRQGVRYQISGSVTPPPSPPLPIPVLGGGQGSEIPKVRFFWTHRKWNRFLDPCFNLVKKEESRVWGQRNVGFLWGGGGYSFSVCCVALSNWKRPWL